MGRSFATSVWVFAASALSKAGADSYSVAKFSFAELHVPSWETRARLRYALQADGALVIAGVPGLGEATNQALDDLRECVQEGVPGTARSSLGSGVDRVTIAASTVGGHIQPLHPDTTAACPRFAQSSPGMRGLVAYLLELFARGADSAVAKGHTKFGSEADRAGHHTSLEELVRSGTHLEHFHRYTKRASSADGIAFDTHTDAGLFQAIAVQWRLAEGASPVGAAGLQVELIGGETAALEGSVASVHGRTGEEGSGILILVGQGAAGWLPHLNVRPAPHSLTLGKGLEERLAYSVMMLPPDDWKLPSKGGSESVLFGEWRRRAQDSLQRVSDDANSSATDGCMSTRRLTDGAALCGQGEMWCWMQCVNVDHIGCEASEAICWSDSLNQECLNGPEDHDASCRPKCAPSEDSDGHEGHEAASPAAEDGFCNGMVTDMHMTGFVWSSEDIPCLVYLFQGLELTSATRFWIAVCGTFLAGVLAEFLVMLRRRLATVGPSVRGKGKTAIFGKALHLAMYALTRTVGYLVMLFAMMYSYEMFIAVIMGLTVGHALFNVNAPGGVDEGMTACCQPGLQPTPPAGGLVSGGLTGPDVVRLAVAGMTCHACEVTVKNAALRVEGVADAAAFAAPGALDLQVSPDLDAADRRAILQRVCENVDDCGFEATMNPDTNTV